MAGIFDPGIFDSGIFDAPSGGTNASAGLASGTGAALNATTTGVGGYDDLIRSTPGLVSYYRFNEASGDFIDELGAANFVITSSGWTYQQTGATDDGNKSVHNSGRIGVASRTITGVPTGSSSRTFEFFYRRIDGVGKETIFSYGATSTRQAWGTAIYSGGALEIWSWADDPTIALSGILDGNFHYIALVYSGGSSVTCYLDGASAGSLTFGGALNTSAGSSLRLSGDFHSGGFNFGGGIDELAIYNVALTSTQVSDHYHAAVDRNVPAGSASGSGLAYNATISTGGAINAPAGLATGTGAVLGASAKVAPNAGNAAGTGVASNTGRSVKASAGAATGTGAAYNPTILSGYLVSAGLASGTGTAGSPRTSIKVNAGAASGTGAAANPAVVAGFTYAQAGLASGTGLAGSAGVATVWIKVNAGAATGTGTAYNALAGARTYALAGLASGSGSTQNASIKIAVGGGPASGTGIAYNAVIALGAYRNALAGLASGSGAAYDPTIAAGSGTATASQVIFIF